MITGIPTYEWESWLTGHGYKAVSGVDEVGRGALAGPLMAGAAILPGIDELQRDIDFWSAVKDSKTLSFKTRTFLADGIRARTRSWAVGTVEAEELDEIGVAAANRTAMERAVGALHIDPDYLLIDATTIDTGLPQQGIIDGDALSLSIAAASIIAKVARDEIMIALHETYPLYGFAGHKGYAARAHLEALVRYGPCPVHRFCYAPVRSAVMAQEERNNAG